MMLPLYQARMKRSFKSLLGRDRKPSTQVTVLSKCSVMFQSLRTLHLSRLPYSLRTTRSILVNHPGFPGPADPGLCCAVMVRAFSPGSAYEHCRPESFRLFSGSSGPVSYSPWLQITVATAPSSIRSRCFSNVRFLGLFRASHSPAALKATTAPSFTSKLYRNINMEVKSEVPRFTELSLIQNTDKNQPKTG